MKKRNFIWLAVVLLVILSLIPGTVSAATSGSCGENLQWEFSGGKLTVNGDGPMADYSEENPAPWFSLREQIVELSLPEGLTRVGSYAFAQCTQLMTVTMPDTVTAVGEKGFFDCERLQFLTLSKNLTRIERGGFERCLRLKTVQLPLGLEYIGYQAFWRCESLMSITVPETVTHLDMAVFAYCGSLVRAQIDAPITKIPQWLFYGCRSLAAVVLPEEVKTADAYAFHGCDTLNTVYFPGDSDVIGDLAEDIGQYLEGFDRGYISSGSSNTADGTVITETENTVQSESTTLNKTESAEVQTQVTQQTPAESTKPTSTQVQIGASITEETGWDEVVKQTESALDTYENQLQDGEKITVNVEVPQGVQIQPEKLAPLAGKPVELTIHTATGEVWTVDLSAQTEKTLKENLVLSYSLTPAEEKWSKKLGGAETYLLKFHRDMQINARIQVRIPTVPARATAFLYQRAGSTLKQLQAVVVDDDGYAHFYLAAVDTKTDYFIGINVTNANTENVLVPQPLQEEQLIPPMQSIDYVITGRKSSWGMNIWQVTGILVAVLVASVAVVGGVLFAMNKRKLQQEKTPETNRRRKK